MDKLRVGVIGVGHMGQYHVNVSVNIAQVEFVGCFDADANRLKEISERFEILAVPDLDELIDKADALVIAVPTVLHFDIAKKCLDRGKHVLVEKPMTETVEQARQLVKLAEEKNLVLQVGHVERFNGAVMELKKVVDHPFLIEARRLAPFNPRIADVGVVLDLMIHDIDIVTNLLGEEIKSVVAAGTSAFTKHEDVAAAVIQFESGCVANISASRATQNKIRTLTITQEKAYIILDFATQDIDIHRMASQAYLMTREELKYRQESFVEKIFVHKDNPLRQEHLHFLSVIKGDQAPITPGRKDVRTLEIAHSILDQIHGRVKA